MIPTGDVLIVALTMFALGLLGVIIRRNILIVLMSIELMLNSVNLTLVGFARAHGGSVGTAGHGFSFLIVALAAAEAAVGLAIVVAVFRSYRTVNVNNVNLMKR
ncbi:MAG: NADH-quinone oxidoreductase subunit NuoK [Deltaproteobacteria bacterium]|nr:NADH-quinone oxidoreductase subunit NuoK [Deltaproteobacteria bacterium]